MGIIKSKSAPTLQDLENEQATLRKQLDESREQQHKFQHELTGLLSSARGLAGARLPLQQAHDRATTATNEARESLTRNLGKETESVHADRLYEAEQRANKTALALADHDAKTAETTKTRVDALRSDLQKVEQRIATLEPRCMALAHEMEQAVERDRVAALIRVFCAYGDLYTVLEQDGPIIARMRTSHVTEWNKLIPDLVIDYGSLFDMMQPRLGARPGEDDRPLLTQRQQVVRDWLARLKK